jgi:minor extracellular serine protease Vpr
MRNTHFVLIFILSTLASLAPLGAAEARLRYALILTDPSVAEVRKNAPQALAENHRQKIAAAQASLRSELARQNFTVTGSVQTVLNAVFVLATPDQVAQLRSMPGVAGVRPLRRFRKSLDAAVPLLNGPSAWALVGGEGRAGRGIKIGVIDSGIDQTHPAFQDNQLAIPSGFPKCTVSSDCSTFTNNKVIVARSYVAQLAAGFGSNPAATSRPDDYSARDLDGHGTAVAMCAAGETNTGPAATITGMAPKAYLGNYKVFGSPEINPFTGGDIIIMALEDALNDGMDIAELSLGQPAISGPLDQGAACGQTGTTPCDPEAAAAENAVQSGMLVVVAAGNQGEDGLNAPTLNTVGSPADAPSAIAVGGSTNSHTWGSGVEVTGAGVPPALQLIQGQFGDGPFLSAPLTAPLKDVGPISGDPLGCNSIPAGSLAGDIALIERGTCFFVDKVNNAQNAGALGVIFWDPNTDTSDSPSGLANTNIPAILIGVTAGTALKSFIDAHPNYAVTLNPNLVAIAQTPNIIASFSSRGPSINGGLKPDVTAVGTDLYMAAERLDPNGDLYSPNGYTAADGTSFATPLVAGAAALVKQKTPGLTALQLKSAVVNTAAQSLTDEFGAASVLSAGAGLLNAHAAVSANVTVIPATISFGFLDQVGSFPPPSQQLEIANSGSSTLNLTLSVTPTVKDTQSQVTLSKSSVSISAGQSTTVTVAISGSTPTNGGDYYGFIVIAGGSQTLHVPYLYVAGDGVPANITAIYSAGGFDCTVGQSVPDGYIAFQLIDDFGEPISNQPIQWSVTQGGGAIVPGAANTDSVTEPYGLGFATVTCGNTPGAQEFTGTVAGLQAVVFDGVARLNPTISPNGAVNAASYQVGNGVAPGSYISLFGTGLSDDTNVEHTGFLPLGIDNVAVSFDVPSAGLSFPGRIYYVSPTQLNLQVPWELQGQTSALIKVIVEDSLGPLYTLPLAPYSPAFFLNGEFIDAEDQSGNEIASSNPASAGQTVVLYVNGLGSIDTVLPTGQPAPLSPAIHTTAKPTVSIGGQQAVIQFSGLAPGYSGLYQLSVAIPAGLSAGVQPVALTINGIAAPPANLPVK